jgi:predicted HTH domain antitoxin
VQITVELPNDLTQHPDPASEALEAVAIAGYRSGNFTEYQARRLLGLTSRFEFEVFLKNRGIYDQAYSVNDLDEDLENLRRLKRASSDEDRWRT